MEAILYFSLWYKVTCHVLFYAICNSSDYFNKLTNRDDSFQNYRGFHHTIGRFRKTNTTIKNYFEIEFEEGKYRPSYKENDDYITVEKYYESNNLDRTNENTTNVKQ